MTTSYQVGGLIRASDINEFISTNNGVWSTGSSNSGYGQTGLSSVVAGQVISQNPMSSLVTTITTAANHQGTSLNPATHPTPASGNLIYYLSELPTNLNLISTNRLNAAQQGSTSTSVNTTTTSWTDSKTVTFTAQFASADAVRYFFNAGGQIGIYASHPAGGGSSINQLISNICSDLGTIWFSSPNSGTVSLAGSSWSGVTKVGGSNPGSTTINSNNGFYSVYPTGTSTLITQYGDTAYHGYQTGTFMRISVTNNGSGLLTFTVLYDEVPNGATVSSGTITTLTVSYPSTSYLTNTWGSPTLGNSSS